MLQVHIGMACYMYTGLFTFHITAFKKMFAYLYKNRKNSWYVYFVPFKKRKYLYLSISPCYTYFDSQAR
jgi:hypothetical protein